LSARVKRRAIAAAAAVAIGPVAALAVSSAASASAPIRKVAVPQDPFTPLGTTSTGSDNLYYTGTSGLEYSVGTGLGYPDLAELAYDFAKS
jgi:hypothetical protein